MRIAIDARELAGQPTGVGRFLQEILTQWRDAGLARHHELVLLAPGEGEAAGTGWEQLTLPRLVRESGADVLLAPGYTAPLRSPVPTVVVIHDVSFAAHPEWFSWREGARRRTITRLAAARAARVITVSHFSKREIVSYLGVDPAKVRVVYHGLSRVATPAAGRNILYVGTIFNRRHIPELIAAFERLATAHPTVALDIVGANRTAPRIDVAALACDSRVRVGSYVDDGRLAELYAGAGAFVFLSDYEGFGLTPLEALGAGIPPVVLDTAVAREIYGDAAIYVATPQPEQIAAAVERALFDEAERARVLRAAADVLPRYSWLRAATQLLQAVEEAAG